MAELITLGSEMAIPIIIVAILTYGLVRKVPVYEEFVAGAKEGVDVALRILPYLVAMFIAVAVFRSSGALDLMLHAAKPLLGKTGTPPEVAPLLVLRPLSGSGSLGYLGNLLSTHGPDSIIGRMASTIQGSCDTTFYIVAVYFGAVGIRKVRHSVWVGLFADLVGFITAIAVCRWVFG